MGIGTRERSRFYARSALLMLAMVIVSFPFTYFGPAISGANYFTPVYHIHGAAYFGWIILYAWQTHLVAEGKPARHREYGLGGIALSALMVPLGVILLVAAIKRRMAAGNPHPFDVTLYNVVDIASFAVLMTLSIASVTRYIEWHRRFTFAAAIALVGPAISRWFLTIPPLVPLTDFGPNIIADLFLVALILHDRRTLGRIHPATLWVTAVLVPIHLLTPFATGTAWWRGIGPVFLRLGG
jgi:hypothetical protein